MNTNNCISLKERLAALAGKKSGSPLYRESLSCVLKGAALDTGQDYFNWRLARIDEEWSAGPSYPYGVAVNFARDNIQKCLDDPGCPDAACADLYYQLLIQLAIEPFAGFERE